MIVWLSEVLIVPLCAVLKHCFVSQDEDEEGMNESLGETKDPTHFSELDPKSMKVDV